MTGRTHDGSSVDRGDHRGISVAQGFIRKCAAMQSYAIMNNETGIAEHCMLRHGESGGTPSNEQDAIKEWSCLH